MDDGLHNGGLLCRGYVSWLAKRQITPLPFPTPTAVPRNYRKQTYSGSEFGGLRAIAGWDYGSPLKQSRLWRRKVCMSWRRKPGLTWIDTNEDEGDNAKRTVCSLPIFSSLIAFTQLGFVHLCCGVAQSLDVFVVGAYGIRPPNLWVGTQFQRAQALRPYSNFLTKQAQYSNSHISRTHLHLLTLVTPDSCRCILPNWEPL